MPGNFITELLWMIEATKKIFNERVAALEAQDMVQDDPRNVARVQKLKFVSVQIRKVDDALRAKMGDIWAEAARAAYPNEHCACDVWDRYGDYVLDCVLLHEDELGEDYGPARAIVNALYRASRILGGRDYVRLLHHNAGRRRDRDAFEVHDPVWVDDPCAAADVDGHPLRKRRGIAERAERADEPGPAY